jgi:MerR family transcriptional regulator, mercuric resistance operon regulatory protein
MSYTIGQLAKSIGISTETIRYYEREGLLEQPPKPDQGYRRYTPAAQTRLQFIRRAQGLGFSLGQIKHLLSLDRAPCQQVKALAVQKRAEVQTRIADLQHLEAALQSLIQRCERNTGDHCPIIEIFSET